MVTAGPGAAERPASLALVIQRETVLGCGCRWSLWLTVKSAAISFFEAPAPANSCTRAIIAFGYQER